MDIRTLSERAMEIRAKYRALEKEKIGREWTRSEVAQGLVGDVGDLMKLVMAKEGLRDIPDADTKLAHELSDCLWCILVLAEKYDIDLEKAFLKTMDELDKRITSEKGQSA
ncbi:nucleotide pyrophosphohydrolase [Candidatus Kaiserbacteria bacterium]|nr:nucleotide pyrophosphohydrolase [Candidatus Kaiserbacteria bacterium]